jgi:nucleoside diphosphate kinase
LKPRAFKNKRIGAALAWLEQESCQLVDLFAVDLTVDNVYSFYEAIAYYPDQAEVETYTGGPALVVGLFSKVGFSEVLKVQELFPCKLFPQTSAIQFLFGAGKMGT